MADDISVKLGQFIKLTRMKKSITQEELAWRCQINVNTLGRIERAEIDLKFSTLNKLLKELQLTFSDLEFLS
ncbi:helix-turn-helix domain-containing protein [Aquella oligotrophica]|uniref:Transcriptional regulator n=1 Tax=Aquella oligotrophica TaxID=2067065 RepID=A0A2I7N3J8_9NEIS|nr:helix-turn-helix transcriptional regulator [Aquella oligotrophica]AUR51022.1 transcriptional regulator [Aquella oligotrophica]